MNQERRRFLKNLAAVCAGGVARTLGVGVTSAVAATAATETAARAAGVTAAAAVGTASVRGQVFEVIVRQAMAGAPWRQICQGPMRVNGITEEQVQREVERRNRFGHSDVGVCQCRQCHYNRVERLQKALAAIPHSQKAPCACNSCRDAVMSVISSIRKKLEE